MQSNTVQVQQEDAPKYVPPEGLQQVGYTQFDNFVRNTKCTEHFVSGETHYYETGSRKLVALFRQVNSTVYLRPRIRVAK